jgi:hypothetical protein
MDRDQGFQERDWPRIRDGQDRLQRTIDAGVDRALLTWALGIAAALPDNQRIPAVDQAASLRPGMSKADADRAIAAYLDGLFAGTKLGDRDFRLSLAGKSTAELLATKDSFILLAAALEPLAEANREAAKNRGGALERLMPSYMEALLAKSGGLVAPDANGTLRVTYGQVKGVDARDGKPRSPASWGRTPGRGISTPPKRNLTPSRRCMRANGPRSWTLRWRMFRSTFFPRWTRPEAIRDLQP